MEDRRHTILSHLTIGVTLFVLAQALSACGGDDDNGGNHVAGFRQTNLVSDQAGAATTDAHLVNAWGIAYGPSTPFWIADNHTGVSTVYDGAGKPAPAAAPLVVIVPPSGAAAPGTAAAPTGLVFNSTADFVITEGANSAPSLFIFATEDGTLSGWNKNVDAAAAILTVDNSGGDAIYKGLALASNSAGNFLFATDFHNGRIDTFDKNFHAVTPAGSFTDPNISAGFAPFGIQNVDGSLYVTYAKQDQDAEDDEAGPGNGYIDVFDTNGNLTRRFASQGTLNSPWGITVAPATFGAFGGALLVGNFGDGHINAFGKDSRMFLGQLTDMNNNPIVISGLWGLVFGSGNGAGDPSILYFTAGPGDEEHGLFGSLQAG